LAVLTRFLGAGKLRLPGAGCFEREDFSFILADELFFASFGGA
jgi:hypothetical protein